MCESTWYIHANVHVHVHVGPPFYCTCPLGMFLVYNMYTMYIACSVLYNVVVQFSWYMYIRSRVHVAVNIPYLVSCIPALQVHIQFDGIQTCNTIHVHLHVHVYTLLSTDMYTCTCKCTTIYINNVHVYVHVLHSLVSQV